MKTSEKPRGTYADLMKSPAEYKDFVFVFELPNRNSEGGSVVDGQTGRVQPFPISVNIPMVGTTYDPKVNKKRRIQFSPGEKSIFPEDWADYKTVPRLKVSLNFLRGRKVIDGSDSDMLEFIKKWDVFGSNLDRDVNKSVKFVLVDTSKQLAKSRESNRKKFDLLKWCHEAPVEKIMSVASVIFNADQLRQHIEDIRYNLSVMAEYDGSTLQKHLDDPKTERVYLVRKAVERGVLVVNTTTNSISWSDNPHAPLSVAVAGQDIVVDFVSKSFSGTGEQYYRAIEGIMTPKQEVAPPVYVATPTAPIPPVLEVPAEKVAEIPVVVPVAQTFQTPPVLAESTIGKSDQELGDIFDKAVAAGVFVLKGPSWKMYEQNGQQVLAANSKHMFIAKIKVSPEILASIEYDIEKAQATA